MVGVLLGRRRCHSDAGDDRGDGVGGGRGRVGAHGVTGRGVDEKAIVLVAAVRGYGSVAATVGAVAAGCDGEGGVGAWDIPVVCSRWVM